MEELDAARYSIKPSSSELAVEVINGSFAWDSLTMTSDKTDYIRRLRTSACRRHARRNKVKPAQAFYKTIS